MNYETGLIHLKNFIEQFEAEDSLYNLGHILDNISYNDITALKLIFDHSNDPELTTIHLRNVLDLLGYDKVHQILILLKGKNKINEILMFLRNVAAQCVINTDLLVEDPEILDSNFFLFVSKILENVINKEQVFNDLLRITQTLRTSDFVLQLSLTQKSIPNFEIFIERLTEAVKTTTTVNWIDAVAIGQINSKKWLLDTITSLELDLGRVCILGGWIGTLSFILSELNLNITSYDIDDDCLEASRILNPLDFNSVTADMFELDLNDFDTIINTSTEHIDYPTWIKSLPSDKIVIVQNNNRTDYEGHICCYKNIDEFVKASCFSNIIYSGSLNVIEYDRAMIIART